MPNHDPLSMIAQLLRVIRPSAIDIARDREREKERARRMRPESLEKQRERMKKHRSKG